MKDIIEEFEKLGYRICKNDDEEISFIKENERYSIEQFIVFHKEFGKFEKYLSKGIVEAISFEEYKLITKIYYILGYLTEFPY